MVTGIVKDGKHSFKDYNMTIAKRNISIPQKQKIKATVPFMNGSYDFSCIYGEQTYEERVLEYTFNYIARSKEHLSSIKIDIVNWLTSGMESKLYDDCIPGYYFLAECESIDVKENFRDMQITAKFKAYPFKISIEQDGHDIWDIFNFELDRVQTTVFSINSIEQIELFNSGIKSVAPYVICSNDMDIIKDGITYKLKAGTSKTYSFELKPGTNKISVLGNGDIEFKWSREVL